MNMESGRKQQELLNCSKQSKNQKSREDEDLEKLLLSEYVAQKSLLLKKEASSGKFPDLRQELKQADIDPKQLKEERKSMLDFDTSKTKKKKKLEHANG